MVIEELLKVSTVGKLLNVAHWDITILEKASELDNPWAVAIDHAGQAAEALAEILIEAQFSTCDLPETDVVTVKKGRPLTLIGYGIGARAIFNCLEILAKRGGGPYVENAVFIGAPISTSSSTWKSVQSVCSGRVVNCYSTSDWFLALMYRAKSWDITVAGIQPVEISTDDTTRAAAIKGESPCTLECTLAKDLSNPGRKNIENFDITDIVR